MDLTTYRNLKAQSDYNEEMKYQLEQAGVFDKIFLPLPEILKDLEKGVPNDHSGRD